MLLFDRFLCQDFFTTLLENMSDGIRIVDHNRITLFWNHAAEHLTGYRAAQMLNKPCYMQLMMHLDEHGTKICQTICPLNIAMQGQTHYETNLLIRHKDGYPMSFRLQVLPLFDDSGTVAGALEIFTPLRKDDSEKIRALSNLAFKDATTELVNRQYAEYKITSMLDEMRYTSVPFGVLMLNIQNLKDINNLYGNAHGDKLLGLIGKILSENIMNIDIASRWQSATFLVVFHNTRKSFLLLYANKLKTLIEQINLPPEDSQTPAVCISGTLAEPDDTMHSIVERLESLMIVSASEFTRIHIDVP